MVTFNYTEEFYRQASEGITTPDIVLSLLGAGDSVADFDLNARDAYQQFLEEKYK